MVRWSPLPESSTTPNFSNRPLPPLPISKRKLPQSKTHFHSTSCVAQSTPNLRGFLPKQSKSLRNLFKKSPQSSNKWKKNNECIMKSKWRPSLQWICDDDELLNCLIMFMSTQYNEENILFLQAVRKLHDNISHLSRVHSEISTTEHEKINAEILHIYRTFVVSNSPKQINLSSDCYRNVMQTCQDLKQYPVDNKHSIFDACEQEIKTLIYNSILPTFYNSESFQSVARLRNTFTNDVDEKQVRQSKVYKDSIFDSPSEIHRKRSQHNRYVLSSKGYNKGYHEWKIKILKSSEHRQEIGVISNFNTKIQMNEYGVCDTPSFASRAVYGYNNLHASFYYASFNKDNTVRCDKDLSKLNMHEKCWKEGDVITVCLNCDQGKIKFLLNDQKVRKPISIQMNTTYYPIILYSGDCEYTVIH